jgi:serine/threonine protein kinase
MEFYCLIFRQYLHAKKIMHRDFKSSNIMVDNKWKCKVGDLGLSTINSEMNIRKTVVGTPGRFLLK